MSMSDELLFVDQLKVASLMLDDESEDAIYGYDFKTEFQKLIYPTLPVFDEAAYLQCSSVRFEEDAVGALYRLLWLIQPERVDFSQTYKTRLFSFMAANNSVLVSVELYKYEPCLYFYAQRAALDLSQVGNIWAGFPGADNEVKVIDETAQGFISLVIKAATTSMLIYGGNNFVV